MSKINLKLLIGGAEHKLSHLKEFGEMFQKLGGEYRLVLDVDVCRGFPSKNFKEWFFPYRKFSNLIKEFKPDLVFVDRQSQFGKAALTFDLPLFVHLRGDYWSELKWAKDTIYRSPTSRTIVWFKNRIAEQCFRDAQVILPLSNYLAKIVRRRYPLKPIETFHQGITPDLWYPVSGMELKHPAVGILQDATIWGKTKELLTLTNVLEKLPHVTFYWAGDGIYREKIMSTLKKYDNFKWLGRLQHPEKVREFLTEIDVYTLITGFDTLGMTTQEAELMRKPVIVTNTGGTSEAMKNNETGFLVEKGDFEGWIEKLSILLNDQKKSKKMGDAGRKFVEESFSWFKKTNDFLEICKKYL